MSDTLKERTAKGIFWGGLSSGLQQLLNLVFGIFLARLLDADDYGMVAMLAVFSLIANTLQESGFTAAIANKKEVTHKDYNAVFWFSCLVGLFLYTVLFFCAPFIAAFYEKPELVALARYSFLGFFISSFGTAHYAYLFRNLMVRQRAISLTVSLFVSGVVGITLAYYGMSYWGIVTQSLVYIVCVTAFNWYFSPWRPSFTFDFSPLRSMLSFSSKLLVTNIFNHLNNNLFAVLLGKFYTEKEAGNYSQASKWNYLGYALVQDTLQNVSQPVLSRVNDDLLRQQNVFRKLLRFTAFIALPVMFGLSFIARELIVITITDKWLPAVDILQLLCISGAFVPIIRLYSNLLISRGKSSVYMWNNIAVCLTLLLALFLARPYGMHNMFVVYVVINIAWFFVWHYFLWREIKLSLWAALKDILPFAFTAVGSIAASAFITRGIENIYFLFAAKIVTTALLYFLVLWICKAQVLKESIAFLTKRRLDS